MARDVSPLSLGRRSARLQQWDGASLGLILPFFPLRSLVLYYFLSCAASATGSLPGIEYDYGISPKFVCTPIPPEADPSCYSPPSVPHGPSSNGHANGHNGSSRRGVMSDEAKATILHLRESLVRQKETILDQRETIRELTAKLTLCEGFGGGHHGTDHHDDRRENHHDTRDENHHDGHPDDHRGHHGGGGGHHGPSSYHGSDHHYSHGGHRPDPHPRKGSSYGKHSSFSPEQTGKTLQTLKERLENLQARNSSSSYSSSLRELLQRKITALEEQLHSYYQDHRDDHPDDHHDDHPDDHHDDHHGSGRPGDDHQDSGHPDGRPDNHRDDHRGTGHRDDHREDHRGTGRRDDHHDDHRGTGRRDDHHDDHRGTGRRDDHHDDHRGSGHRDDHHDSGHHGSPRNNHRTGHHSRYQDHHYDWHHGGRQRGYYGSHHSPHHDDHHDDHHGYHDYRHGPGHRDDHHDDHHDDHRGDDHHDDDRHGGRHGNDHNPRRLPFDNKETSLRGAGHDKLETVLSQLHLSPGNHKKLKTPSAFLLDFPMKTNYMYARMKRSPVNEIFALTICLRLKAGAGPGLGTPFSYAVPGQANELVLIEWGSNPMELLISDKAVALPMAVSDGKWHHVCVTWTTRDGVWEAYQDGVKKGSGQNLSAWRPIEPGGTFVLGQEQDTMGGRFDVTQSFTGELSDFQFWSRVLTTNEIYSQATCGGGRLIGDVMSWSEESVELHGGLTEVPFEPCH
ncbi:neuronal pentraxin-1-like [Cyclopterus lumpus]|uniref:neuronal pentraxin-1-like n=1 Tax=Cyclopterus lumpus TaxID=8103 RepID=UPI001486EB6B|nr:neuronal pentraxin-1-like [Cyclopterus lumpus]